MKVRLWLCFFLVAATMGVYWQTGGNGFINFDDIDYVAGNPHVSSGLNRENIVWAFTSTHAANWHPLTWLSHMADSQFLGPAPGGHHLTSAIIHAFSSMLLFLLFERITGMRWQSFMVAALFALHPLHVESVAWIAERKDVLSGLFWVLTLLLYAEYVKTSSRTLYILTVCSFAAGLMSKPMLVTLPIIMLLLDFWPFCRSGLCHSQDKAESHGSARLSPAKLLAEKIPFLFLAALSSTITIYAQNTLGSLASLEKIPLLPRISNAVVAYAKYILKMIVPYDLAIFYPFRTPPLWQVAAALFLLATVSAAVFRYRKHCPYLLFGWLLFLVTLLPVIGIVQVGDQAMADRYTYLPYTGLFIMLCWGISDLAGNYRYRTAALSVLACAAIAACSLLTNHQLGYWKSDTALFKHAIGVTSDNYKAHHALGVVLAKQRNFEEALRHLSTAIRLIPGAVIPRYDMGVALEASGRAGEAVQSYLKVISMNPGHVGAHTQLGGILCREGQFETAFSHFSTAIQLDPGYLPARVDLDGCMDLFKATSAR